MWMGGKILKNQVMSLKEPVPPKSVSLRILPFRWGLQRFPLPSFTVAKSLMKTRERNFTPYWFPCVSLHVHVCVFVFVAAWGCSVFHTRVISIQPENHISAGRPDMQISINDRYSMLGCCKLGMYLALCIMSPLNDVSASRSVKYQAASIQTFIGACT